MVRYGVFNLGQLWCVVGENGAERGFPTRVSALDAAGMILNAHRACGEAVELLVQDTVGRLSVLTEAPSAFVEQEPPRDAQEVVRMRPRQVRLRAVD
jgi:hypothetical protein